MKKEGFQKRRKQVPKRNALAQWNKMVPNNDLGTFLSRKSLAWRSPPMLKQRSPLKSTEGMQVAAIPLAVSGFSPSAFAQLSHALKDFPLTPMQAGGTGDASRGPKEFQMGGPISVQLIRGDMSAAGTGTVSYIEGNRVLAFGHPMFQAGEFYAPVAAAEIHTVIPSARSAFIVASPLRELGALVQDRQSTIAADTQLKVRMIPVHITLRSKTGASIGNFNVEVLNSRFFTSTFAGVAATNAVSLYLPDRDRVRLRVKSKVHMKGFKPMVFVDHLYSERGAKGIVGGIRGLRVLSPLMNNPYGEVQIQKLELDIDVAFDTQSADIEGLRLQHDTLLPGQKNLVEVKMDPYQGKAFYQSIEVFVPKHLAGSIVKLEVSAGDIASMYIAQPKTLSDLVKAFRTLLPGTVMTATLYSASPAVALHGTLIHDMPGSALNRLRKGSETQDVGTKSMQIRSLHPVKMVLDGEATLLVKVAPLSR